MIRHPARLFGSLFATAMTVAMFATVAAAAPGLDTNSPLLPPAGEYRTPQQVHADYQIGFTLFSLSDISHFGFTSIFRSPIGSDEIETFNSTITGFMFSDGNPAGPVILTGPVTVRVSNYTSSQTGTFQTEMLAMDLTGGGVWIRESPTLPSLGQTSITDIGGGMYHIDSFFDVFTELTLDNGQSWTPSSNGPAHVDLLPEPTSLALLAVSGLALLRRRTA